MNQTKVVLSYEGGKTVKGRAISTEGKRTDVKIARRFTTAGQVKQIQVVGREDPTAADNARSKFVLALLQGTISIDGNDFLRQIYFPTRKDKAAFRQHEQGGSNVSHQHSHLVDTFLNDAQSAVANALLSPSSHSIILVQGPPGTGKTRTIAAAARVWAADSSPAWIVAQSNVGVKRIAESLIKSCKDFLLLVSQDFYFEW